MKAIVGIPPRSLLFFDIGCLWTGHRGSETGSLFPGWFQMLIMILIVSYSYNIYVCIYIYIIALNPLELHNISFWKELHKPDFAGFSQPFHRVFTGFSWPFQVFFTVSLFSQISKVRPQFFKHGISLGVGPCPAKSHKNTISKIIT